MPRQALGTLERPDGHSSGEGMSGGRGHHAVRRDLSSRDPGDDPAKRVQRPTGGRPGPSISHDCCLPRYGPGRPERTISSSKLWRWRVDASTSYAPGDLSDPAVGTRPRSIPTLLRATARRDGSGGLPGPGLFRLRAGDPGNPRHIDRPPGKASSTHRAGVLLYPRARPSACARRPSRLPRPGKPARRPREPPWKVDRPPVGRTVVLRRGPGRELSLLRRGRHRVHGSAPVVATERPGSVARGAHATSCRSPGEVRRRTVRSSTPR
jgi:hypothetical protein